jgi:hypothetical protein
MLPRYYTLDDTGSPVPCDDTAEWSCWYAKNEKQRTISRTNLQELGTVSTIFLAVDHGYGFQDPLRYKPVLWETMVFGGPLDQYQRRYTSQEEARQDHERIVSALKTQGSYAMAS